MLPLFVGIQKIPRNFVSWGVQLGKFS